MSSEQFRSLPLQDLAHIDWHSPEEVERAVRLNNILRFGTIEEMTHRTSVLVHEGRVAKGALVISRVLSAQGVAVDLKRVLFLADHHDDIEMETGDIPTPVKESATKEELKKMEEDERVAAEKIDHLVQKPLFFRSFPEEYEEYKSQKTIEARIVSYMDKWDGIHEAIHEVICGDNKETFREVIEKYKPLFVDLMDKNKDWQIKLKNIFGDDFFSVPDPEKLVSKMPIELDYTNVFNFMRSVAQDNPISYFFWLRFNKSLFRLDFLRFVFPGWIDKFPPIVLKDIERVRKKQPFKKSDSGLWVPSNQKNVGNLTFGESLEFDILEPQLAAIAMISTIIPERI